MNKIAMCGVIVAMLTMGCGARNYAAPVAAAPQPTLSKADPLAPDPGDPFLTPLPPNPIPTPVLTPSSQVMVVPSEYLHGATCHDLTVKVGKLDVNMPHGGSLEIEGVKTSTTQYHIVLEDVEFSTKECP